MNYRKILEDRRTFSEGVVATLRQRLDGALPLGMAVVVTGSFARKEASAESDVDYFLVIDGEGISAEQIAQAHGQLAVMIEALSLKGPSQTGAFGKESETLSDLLRNVGGDEDLNAKLTHRLLLLLEGDWLFGRDIFEKARRQLIEDVYARSAISDHQIVRFLLNDLVRYWRTIGVDFEFKTVEAGKGWGIRNIKLVYSRKLMYFSGVLMVAETAQSTRDTKVRTLLDLIQLCPLGRIEKILGTNCEKVLELYSNFLVQVADPSVRERFEKITLERETQTEEFKNLKNAGHHFSLHLEQLLKTNYPPSHPIHHAMLF